MYYHTPGIYAEQPDPAQTWYLSEVYCQEGVPGCLVAWLQHTDVDYIHVLLQSGFFCKWHKNAVHSFTHVFLFYQFNFKRSETAFYPFSIKLHHPWSGAFIIVYTLHSSTLHGLLARILLSGRLGDRQKPWHLPLLPPQHNSYSITQQRG